MDKCHGYAQNENKVCDGLAVSHCLGSVFSQVAAGECVVLGAFLDVTHYKMSQYYEVFTVSLAAQKGEIKAVKARDELNDPMMSVVGNVSLSNVSHGKCQCQSAEM